MSYCSMTKTIKQGDLKIETVKEELISELSKKFEFKVLSSDSNGLKVLIKPIAKSKRYMKLIGDFSFSQTENETVIKFFGKYKMTPKGLGSMLFGIFILPLAGAGIFVLAAIFKKNNDCMQNIHATLKESMMEFYLDTTGEIELEDSIPQSS
jgi:lauroyl/myristoyl acyltransferase